MTSPTREATHIRCPGCGAVYDEWWHITLGLALDEGRPASAVTSSCPDCGHIVARELLVSDGNGVLEPAGLEADE